MRKRHLFPLLAGLSFGLLLGLAGCGQEPETPALPQKTVEPQRVPATDTVETTGTETDEPAEALRKKLNANHNAMMEVKDGQIISASLMETGVKDLSPQLFLEETQVKDLRPLKDLPLDKLHLNKTLVRDLSPLSGMSLEELNLQETPVETLDDLKNTRLGTLWIPGTQVKSLEPLRGQMLVSLDIGNTPVSDLSPLAEMTSLQRLNIIHTQIRDLTPLAKLTLSRLLFTPRNITKGLEVVQGMQSLRELDITFREPERLTPKQFWQQYNAGTFER